MTLYINHYIKKTADTFLLRILLVRTKVIKKLIFLFIIWRLLLLGVAYLSPIIIPQFGARFPYFEGRLISSGLPHFIWSFGNFDGVHYLGIAQDEYAYQFTQAFFPLYPILIKLFSYLTSYSLLVSGFLISNLAFLCGLVIFFKLTKEVYDEKIAFWSCLFLLSFPTSFFFGSIYTEGLFFLLIISSFYLFYKKKIIFASIVGSFASATRLAGIFLAPSLALRRDFKTLIPILIAPSGLIAYILYLQIKFHNPLYFLSAQPVFGQERMTTGIVLLPQVFWRYSKILLTTNGLVLANAAFELSSTIFALAVLFIGFKKVRSEWLVFSLLAVLVPTLTGTLASMPRYILVAFPIYIILAAIKNTMIKSMILIIFLFLLIISTIFFTQGYWVA